MKKSYSLFILLIFSLPIFGQNNNFWLDYSAGNWVYDIAFEGDTVWSATTGGVTELIPSTGQTIFFNASNSGLNTNKIYKIAVDQSHLKWIGADNGLYTFDGVYWKHFFTGYIYDLEVDLNNNVWFNGINPLVGDTGLVKYDGNTFITVTTLNSGLPNNNVTRLATDSSKNLWLIADYSIVKYDGVSWQVIDSTNTILSGTYTQSLTVDANNKVWIGSYQNIYFFNGASWATLDTSNTPLVYSALDGITPDDSGNVYICNNRQLLKTDGTNWFVYDTINSPAAAYRFFSSSFDQNHNLWVGTGNNSVYKYDYSQWIQYNTSNSGLGWYATEGLALGKNGEVWVNQAGYFTEKNDSVWSHSPILPSGCNGVNYMAVDTNNIFWGALSYSTNPGGPIAASFDGTNWSFTNFVSRVCNDITVDGFNNKWFGTYNHGLVKYDGINWTEYNATNSQLADNDVYRVFADKHNNVWAATYNGSGMLQKFDGTNWQTFNLQSVGFGAGSAGCITQDLQGNIFVSAGLLGNAPPQKIGKYDGTAWTFLSQQPGSFIGAMTVDHSNNLWVGFYDSGLAKYDGSSWVLYDAYNSGLPENTIYGIEADRYDNIWISTVYGGLVVFNERGLNFTTPVPERVSVSGHCFFDVDSNGIKNGTEPYLNNQKIIETTTNSSSYTNSQGEYKFFLTSGNYNLSPQLNAGWHVSTDSLTYTVAVDSSDLSGFDFGITAAPVSNYALDLTSAVNRCGFNVPYWIHYVNTGTQLDSGYVEFIADSSCTFISSYPPPDFVNNITYRWNFSSLIPSMDQYIRIKLLIPNSPGDSVHQSASLYYYNASQPVLASFASIDDEILCAVDPNDKTVKPVGVTQQHYTLKSDTLNYTVRFQNVGNDTAFFVKIIDTLDVNIDPQSIKVISASHSYNMTHQNGVLTFDFPVCKLPPASVNQFASCGYIRFIAKAYSSIGNNSVIRNKAFILFNFNESVATNEVFNTMVDTILSNSLYSIEKEGLKIIPNPFSEQTKIFFPNPGNSFYHITVRNLLGQAVLSFDTDKSEATISGKKLKPGIFIIEISDSRKKFFGKLVIE